MNMRRSGGVLTVLTHLLFWGCCMVLPTSSSPQVRRRLADVNVTMPIRSTPRAPVPMSPSTSPNTSPSSDIPLRSPSTSSSSAPRQTPAGVPSVTPSASPSSSPSVSPSVSPSTSPSSSPSAVPTTSPSSAPSAAPTAPPSSAPSLSPTTSPSILPSAAPSASPSTSPSAAPTTPPSSEPSAAPSVSPSTSPSSSPSAAPTTLPSSSPSAAPSASPSTSPSAAPTTPPSSAPSVSPSTSPSSSPSAAPTTLPSSSPSAAPNASPSKSPSVLPSAAPTTLPSSSPSHATSASPSEPPSSSPSAAPSAPPSASSSATPSVPPSVSPSTSPSEPPSDVPSASPIADPSSLSSFPSASPSVFPGDEPTVPPSAIPSAFPSVTPTSVSSSLPTMFPSWRPTTKPSTEPSHQPILSLSQITPDLPFTTKDEDALTDICDGSGLSSGAYNAALTLWNEQPSCYEYTFTAFNLVDELPSYRVSIDERGATKSAMNLDDGSPITDLDILNGIPTMDEIFGTLQSECLECASRFGRPFACAASFDPTDGHVTRLTVDPFENVFDDELAYGIDDLVAASCPTPRAVPRTAASSVPSASSTNTPSSIPSAPPSDGPSSNPSVAPSDASDGLIDPPPLEPDVCDGSGLSKNEYDTAFALWNEQPTCYEYTFTVILGLAVPDYLVVVEDGFIKSVTNLDDSSLITDSGILRLIPSMTEIFGALQSECFDCSSSYGRPFACDASLDATDGHVTRLFVDPFEETLNDETHYEIKGVVIKSCPTPNAAPTAAPSSQSSANPSDDSEGPIDPLPLDDPDEEPNPHSSWRQKNQTVLSRENVVLVSKAGI